MAKVRRQDFELTPQLEEQIGFLLASMDAYDAGSLSEAKRMGATLRVLLHDGRQAVSLFSQVGLKRCDFQDTAGDLIPHNMVPESRLTVMQVSSEGAQFVPRCQSPGRRPRWRTFERWWRAAVIKTSDGATFSRADLVLTMADQDGGAHIDPGLDEKYYRLTRDNSLGWVHSSDGKEMPTGGPQAASIRQIADEVLMTLQKWAVGAIPEDRKLPRSERRR